MLKLTLKPSPTFQAPVEISVPGESTPRELVFTFVHRTREQLKDFTDQMPSRSDLDNIMGMISGWELEDAFTRENVGALVDGYFDAGSAIAKTYIKELTKARLGN